jgi:hypothetical protein
MYDPPGAVLFGGGAVGTAGALALTGFNSLFFALLGIVLVVLGAVLVRAMSVAVEREDLAAGRTGTPGIPTRTVGRGSR